MSGLDLVLDTVGGDTLMRSYQTVRIGGAVVTTVGAVSSAGIVLAEIDIVYFVVQPSRIQLIKIGYLVDTSHVRPLVSGVEPLDRARLQFERGLRGHIRGKLFLEART